MVLFDAHPLVLEIGPVEFFYHPQGGIIRGDVDQAVTLCQTHAIGDRHDVAADDTWWSGERHANPFFQDPVYELLQILLPGRVCNSWDNQLHNRDQPRPGLGHEGWLRT